MKYLTFNVSLVSDDNYNNNIIDDVVVVDNQWLFPVDENKKSSSKTN